MKAKEKKPEFIEIADPSVSDETVVNRKEVLAYLRMSSPTLWRNIKRGRFPQPLFRVGSRYRWRAGDIRRWKGY